MSSSDNSGKSFRLKSAKLKSIGSSIALSAKRLVSISGLLLSPAAPTGGKGGRPAPIGGKGGRPAPTGGRGGRARDGAQQFSFSSMASIRRSNPEIMKYIKLRNK